MNPDEQLAAIESLPEGCVDAINALMEFARTTNEHNLSIGDLQRGLQLAVADGHDTMVISLHMALMAFQLIDEVSTSRLPTAVVEGGGT